MSSLACKCVFYIPEYNAKGGTQETKFWKSLNAKMKYTDEELKKKKTDEKNGIISLVIMFMGIMELWALLSADDIKKLVTVWVKHLFAPERSF